MQTATSETESKSLDLSICVHHYTLRAPCPKGQGIASRLVFHAPKPGACGRVTPDHARSRPNHAPFGGVNTHR